MSSLFLFYLLGCKVSCLKLSLTHLKEILFSCFLSLLKYCKFYALKNKNMKYYKNP